jgi:hypothetical protein
MSASTLRVSFRCSDHNFASCPICPMHVMYSYFTHIDLLYTYLIAQYLVQIANCEVLHFLGLPPASCSQTLYIYSFLRGEQLSFAHKSGYWKA